MAKIKLHKKEAENLAYGGSFDFWQEGTSFTSMASSTGVSDGFTYFKTGTMVNDCNQVADVPTGEGKLTSCSKTTVTTAQGSIGAGDYAIYEHRTEGLDYAKLIGKNIVVSFYVKATKTGTSCAFARNSADTRTYLSEFTINASEVWERKVIKFKADSVGTWLTNNGIGMKLGFALAAGTTFHGTADTWNAGAYMSTVNQINHVDNTANIFQIAGVMIHEGIEEFPEFKRTGLTYDQELLKCQRYYVSDGSSISFNARTTSQASGGARFPVEMRTVPTITLVYGGVDGRVRSYQDATLYDNCTTQIGLFGSKGFGAIENPAATWVVGNPNRLHTGYRADAKL